MPVEIDFLKDKLEYLLNDKLPIVIFPHKKGNQTDLVRCINEHIKPEKDFTSRLFSAAISRDNIVFEKEKTGTGKIDKGFLKKLGQCFKFDIDADVFVTGSLQDFKEHYQRKYEEQQEKPQSANRRLVTLTLSLDQEGLDSATINMTLRCRIPPYGSKEIASRPIGINRGTIYLYCGAGEVTKKMDENGTEKSLWLAEAEILQLTDKRGEIVTIRGGGDSKNPLWEIEAEPDKYLDNVAPNEPYCTVELLEKGDVLVATFETYPKDASFVIVDKKAQQNEVLTCDQQAIIDCLEKQALSPGEDDDSAVFCRHRKIFRAGGR